jgi:hypothetical protein
MKWGIEVENKTQLLENYIDFLEIIAQLLSNIIWALLKKELAIKD